jgi:predicted 3-demethylubiquinone-9 3-methyltransferase (glyoxalase superfamily)
MKTVCHQRQAVFLCAQRGKPTQRTDKMGFTYKEQFAVVVMCKDEKEQESIYNRLKAEGYKLKVVAV